MPDTSSIVCKFGGSSLASASQIRKAQQIVQSNPDRHYVVCSAPGKRYPKDQKITDLLYLCHEHASRNLPFDEVFNIIRERYLGIIRELELDLDLTDELDDIRHRIRTIGETGGTPDFAASRGEHLNARIIAALLDWDFVDAADIIFFNAGGRLDTERTYAAAAERLTGKHAVVPGFYGTDAQGDIRTFSRGGSDITGAIVARAVEAATYENWTDVSGLLITDPRIVPEAYPIEIITYQELRELSYSGATVLHEDAVFPVREVGIPVRICNTNAPEDPGTIIVTREHPKARVSYDITGIAGRKDFTVIQIEKAMMNSEIGFGRRVLQAIEDQGVSFEHMPSGIDTLCVVIDDNQLGGDKLEGVLAEINTAVHPDSITVTHQVALITVVGRGMARYPGLAARIFGALGDNNINIRMMDFGSSQLNLIVGVDVNNYERAIECLYRAFVREDAAMHEI